MYNCDQVALVSRRDAKAVRALRWYLYDRYPIANIKVSGRWKTVHMHRLILGTKRGHQVDHVNRSTLDNRRSNLRFATPHQNNVNQKNRVNNKSGTSCLGKQRGYWRVSVRIKKGKRIQRNFKIKKEAIECLQAMRAIQMSYK